MFFSRTAPDFNPLYMCIDGRRTWLVSTNWLGVVVRVLFMSCGTPFSLEPLETGHVTSGLARGAGHPGWHLPGAVNGWKL